jgi:hypothetical protein
VGTRERDSDTGQADSILEAEWEGAGRLRRRVVLFHLQDSDAQVLRECSIPGAFIGGADIERKYALEPLFAPLRNTQEMVA